MVVFHLLHTCLYSVFYVLMKLWQHYSGQAAMAHSFCFWAETLLIFVTWRRSILYHQLSYFTYYFPSYCLMNPLVISVTLTTIIRIFHVASAPALWFKWQICWIRDFASLISTVNHYLTKVVSLSIPLILLIKWPFVLMVFWRIYY